MRFLHITGDRVKYLIELGNQPNYQQINTHVGNEDLFKWSCPSGHTNIANHFNVTLNILLFKTNEMRPWQLTYPIFKKNLDN